jgi:hypothetical protein
MAAAFMKIEKARECMSIPGLSHFPTVPRLAELAYPAHGPSEGFTADAVLATNDVSAADGKTRLATV